MLNREDTGWHWGRGGGGSVVEFTAVGRPTVA